jgi:cell division protein FtsZ
MLLGASGLGAGVNPELGRQEAENNVHDIKNLLSDGTKMVFVTAGMGGGTGTGAAPVVAKVAKDMGLLTIGVVTIPFFFEKKKKIVKALKGVDELRKNVDAILIVNNERLCDVYSNSEVPIKEAFQRADNILKDAVKGISELITVHSEGSINLDFRDVEATMKNGGGAIMAMGRASGKNRVEKAIIDALDSPLLYGNDIGKAKRILFNIYASEAHPIFVSEMQEIDDFFDQLDPNIDVIWGTSTDDTLGEDAKVTILATGLEDDLRCEVKGNVHRDDDDFYEDLIPRLYKPVVKKKVAEVITQQELEFKVEPAPEPEPAPVPEPEEDEEPTMLSKWRAWLRDFMKDVTE